VRYVLRLKKQLSFEHNLIAALRKMKLVLGWPQKWINYPTKDAME